MLEKIGKEMKESKKIDVSTEEKIKEAARTVFIEKDLLLHVQEILRKKQILILLCLIIISEVKRSCSKSSCWKHYQVLLEI